MHDIYSLNRKFLNTIHTLGTKDTVLDKTGEVPALVELTF